MNSATQMISDPKVVLGLFALLGGTVAACGMPSPHVGSSRDDKEVEEIGLWEQQPTQFADAFYVRPPDQEYGDGNGSSWDNAYSGLPEELQRGARYFLASGDYYEGPPSERYHTHVLDDPEDGEQIIGIYKATVAEHGDASDWQDNLDNGPVQLGPLAIVTGYYDINGSQGANSGDYGIEIHTRDCTRRAGAAIGAPVVFTWDSVARRVSLQQLDIADCGSQEDLTLPAQDAIYAIAPVSQLTLRDCTVRDSWRNLVHLDDAFDVLIERNRFLRSGDHASGASVMLREARNVVVRRNAFVDAHNTFIHLEGARNIIFSANVLMQQDVERELWAAVFSDGPALNVLVVGNTLFNLRGSDVGAVFDGSTTKLRVANNLWAGCAAGTLRLDGAHDHNAFYDNWQWDGDLGSLDEAVNEPTAQLLQDDPFVDSAAFDLALAVPTEAGASVLEPFVGVDYAGLNRGGDGLWDRGAFEHRPAE